jgi:hypothetical protein
MIDEVEEVTKQKPYVLLLVRLIYAEPLVLVLKKNLELNRLKFPYIQIGELV